MKEEMKDVAAAIVGDISHIGTAMKFNQRDKKLVSEIQTVLETNGIKGKVIGITVDCGTPSPKPEIELHCYYHCYFMPDDRLVCEWICT